MNRRRFASTAVTWIAAWIEVNRQARAEDVATDNSIADAFSRLETQFGGPGSGGLGTAVFFTPHLEAERLEQEERRAYRTFTGAMWDRFCEAAWMGPWRLVYARAGTRGILDELRSLPDPETARSAVVMLEGADDPDAARDALVRAFDAPGVMALHIYNIGDGAAMSGLIIAARHETGEAVCLVFLLD